MIFRSLVIVSLLVASSATAFGIAEKASVATDKLTTDYEKGSYALGVTIGSQIMRMLQNNSTKVDAAFFAMGIQDMIAENTPAMDPNAVQAAVQQLTEEAQAKEIEKNQTEGKAYMEANAKKEGVKVTASGLQYRVIKEGEGKKPTAANTVRVHYKGTHIDGTEFDSSYKRGQAAEFPLNGVIPGWTEGMQLMKEGAKYEFVIPYELAYGENGNPRMGMPPASTLVFEVELLEVKPGEEPKSIQVAPKTIQVTPNKEE